MATSRGSNNGRRAAALLHRYFRPLTFREAPLAPAAAELGFPSEMAAIVLKRILPVFGTAWNMRMRE